MSDEISSGETITLSVKSFRIILEAFIVVAVGGASGFAGYTITGTVDPNSVASLRQEIKHNPELRADPYTGAQGRAVEKALAKLAKRVDMLPPRSLEQKVESNAYRIGKLEFSQESAHDRYEARFDMQSKNIHANIKLIDLLQKDVDRLKR